MKSRLSNIIERVTVALFRNELRYSRDNTTMNDRILGSGRLNLFPRSYIHICENYYDIDIRNSNSENEFYLTVKVA